MAVDTSPPRHIPQHLGDVNIHRAGDDTPPASHAAQGAEVLRIVAELAEETVAQPFRLGGAGVVAAGDAPVVGAGAGVPHADALDAGDANAHLHHPPPYLRDIRIGRALCWLECTLPGHIRWHLPWPLTRALGKPRGFLILIGIVAQQGEQDKWATSERCRLAQSQTPQITHTSDHGSASSTTTQRWSDASESST